MKGGAVRSLLKASVTFPLVMPDISSNKPYRVGRSKTGLGLFATKPDRKSVV